MSDPQRIDVSYVADLARLRLSDDEIGRFQKQLGDIVHYIAKLQEVDISTVPETADSLAFQNNLRPDHLGESLSAAQALSNAPQKGQDLFIVPKIVE